MNDDGLKQEIRKFALQNAIFFKGQANPKAVIGKILGGFPEYRTKSKEVGILVNEIVSEINGMSLDEQTAELEKEDPTLLVRERKERTYELPELENAEKGVVMRIAPGPSGPLHIGHTRVAVLNDEYVKKYGGRLVLRIEDTNPENIDSDSYEMIKEDLEWLGVKIDETYVQSDRFDIYFEHVDRLIEMGKVYVCTCDGDDWRSLKEKCEACPCRELPVEEQAERFGRMMDGSFREGEAIAVVKTDLNHPNPAIRDFVALRIVEHPHPLTGDRYRVYPMMNFSVAIDDHLMGMTHVIRGKDHLNNTHRQTYIFDYFGWDKPVYHHYGLVNIPDTVLKTSTIRECIQKGEYSGWDDVRTGTVRALELRGIKPDALRRYWVEAGMKAVDIQFSWDNLYGMNRDIIDDQANRYFFVQDPVRYDISGRDEIEGSAPMHPDHPDRGERKYLICDSKTVFISSEDSKDFCGKGMIRLKDLCNIRYGTPAVYDGDDLSILRQGVHAVQWVCRDSVKTTVLMPDGSVVEGLAEIAVLDERSEIVQFERFGFVRLLERTPDLVKAVFSHR